MFRYAGFGVVLLTALEGAATPFAYADETAVQATARIERQRMEDTTPTDAFRYLSGNLSNFHNHPVIYAAGVGLNARLYVVGKGVRKVYPLNMRDEAFEAYEELLHARGYLGD